MVTPLLALAIVPLIGAIVLFYEPLQVTSIPESAGNVTEQEPQNDDVVIVERIPSPNETAIEDEPSVEEEPVDTMPEIVGALPAGIEITGPRADDCEQGITAAFLLMLEEHDRSETDWYSYVDEHVEAINCVDSGSGMNMAERVFDVGEATFMQDEYWLASVIVHDARHSEQYSNGTFEYGEESELDAIRTQLQALEDMDAPQYLIDYVEEYLNGGSDYWNIEDRYW